MTFTEIQQAAARLASNAGFTSDQVNVTVQAVGVPTQFLSCFISVGNATVMGHSAEEALQLLDTKLFPEAALSQPQKRTELLGEAA